LYLCDCALKIVIYDHYVSQHCPFALFVLCLSQAFHDMMLWVAPAL
jgi:hypothetical protein